MKSSIISFVKVSPKYKYFPQNVWLTISPEVQVALIHTLTISLSGSRWPSCLFAVHTPSLTSFDSCSPSSFISNTIYSCFTRTMNSHYDEELIDYENESVDYVPDGPQATVSPKTNPAGPRPGGDYELIDYEDGPVDHVPDGPQATASSKANLAGPSPGGHDELIDYEDGLVDYVPGGPESSKTNLAGPRPGGGDYELIDYEENELDVVVPNGAATASSATDGAGAGADGEGDKGKQDKFTGIHNTGFRYL